MPEPLKYKYNQAFVQDFANRTQAIWSDFPTDRFEQLVFDADWDGKELMDRLHHLTACLRQTLPQDYSEAVEILKGVSPGLTYDFLYMFLPDFVEQYGLDEWEISMRAFEILTRSSSGEFAVRPFIIQDEKRMMAQMLAWTKHENEHVRRLATEGCRPRLPWAMGLPDFKKDPAPILPILEALKQDESLYVRRSVANNLNDISKDHPELVLDICIEWNGNHPDTDWIVKHASRTLLKKGHPKALALFGFGNTKDFSITNLRLDHDTIRIGDDQIFHFKLEHSGKKPQLARLEYVVSYQKAKGKTSPKVFQISEKEVAPGQHTMTRKQSFRNFSTRKHYPGRHEIAVLVNGEEKARIDFDLLP